MAEIDPKICPSTPNDVSDYTCLQFKKDSVNDNILTERVGLCLYVASDEAEVVKSVKGLLNRLKQHTRS